MNLFQLITNGNHFSMKLQDENSISRQRKAAVLPKNTIEEILAVLGDSEDPKYPIYMTGTTRTNKTVLVSYI